MKKTNVNKTCLVSVFALCLAASAYAQAAQEPSGAPPSAGPDPGLVGNSYSEASLGYQKQEFLPYALRDYGFVTNGSALKEGAWGLDGNLAFDYLYGEAVGVYDHVDNAEAGLTNFIVQSWGRPFITTDAGYAWERAGDVSRRSFAYTLTGGVEFEVLRNLALAPYVDYEAEPHLYNHEVPVASLPDHLTTYGVKAMVRLADKWRASVGLDVDQYSGSDLGYRAGISYAF